MKVKLTENDIKKMVSQAVKGILKEYGFGSAWADRAYDRWKTREPEEWDNPYEDPDLLIYLEYNDKDYNEIQSVLETLKKNGYVAEYDFEEEDQYFNVYCMREDGRNLTGTVKKKLDKEGIIYEDA